jgi:CheY-like chemotaxis protein
MTITKDRGRTSTAFARKEMEHAHTSVNRLRDRLRTLASISTESTAAARGASTTRDALTLLNVIGCIIQVRQGESEEGGLFLNTREGVESNSMRILADNLKSRIVSTGHSLTIQDLRQQYPTLTWLVEHHVDGYLGVPIFGSERSVCGVVAVFGDRNRIFGEEDEWWLQNAGQLVSDLFGYEAVLGKQRSLEQFLVSGGSVEQSEEAEHKPTILVIDDDRDVNDLICEFLTMDGYEVEPAFDGVEAIQTFRPAKHDLVITDVAMPRMNGWELIAALRVRSPTLPIILISGYQTGELNLNYLAKQGVSTVLTKPLDLSVLTTIVRRLLRPSALLASV